MMIGWFNLFQKGYLHRDVSIGNVVIVEDAVTTQAFGILKNKDRNAKLEDITKALQVLKIHSFVKATFEDKLTVALAGMGITDKCLGFVIGGDLAIKMIDYLNKEHSGSRSVRWNLELSWNCFDFVRRVSTSSCRMTS